MSQILKTREERHEKVVAGAIKRNTAVIDKANKRGFHPFSWETTLPNVPEVVKIEASEGIHSTKVLRGYLATNQEFWKLYWHSRKQAWQKLPADHYSTVRAVAYRFSNGELQPYLDALNVYCVLKGEYIVAHVGFTLLTNYRLLFNYNGWWNIALGDLNEYKIALGKLLIEFEKDGKIETLNLGGQYLIPELVLEVKKHSADVEFTEHQVQLLAMQRSACRPPFTDVEPELITALNPKAP